MTMGANHPPPPASHPDVDCGSLLPWEDQKVFIMEAVPGLGRNGQISDLECEVDIAL